MKTPADEPRTYSLDELRAMTPEQRAALMPTAADALGALLAIVAETMQPAAEGQVAA